MRCGILTPCGDTRRAQSQATRDGNVPGRKQPLLLMVLGGHKAVQAEGLTYEPEGEEHEQGAYVPVREAGLIGDGVVEGEEDEEVQSEDGNGVGADPQKLTFNPNADLLLPLDHYTELLLQLAPGAGFALRAGPGVARRGRGCSVESLRPSAEEGAEGEGEDYRGDGLDCVEGILRDSGTDYCVCCPEGEHERAENGGCAPGFARVAHHAEQPWAAEYAEGVVTEGPD